MSAQNVRLADVATKIGSGITPRGGSAVYKSSGRPFVRSQNVGWGTLRLKDLAHIDEATHSTFPATQIRADDVLLNITGASIGRSAVATRELAGGNVNQHVCLIRLKPGRMDPLFVSTFLLSTYGQEQVGMFQAGGNREGLNFQQVGSIQVPDLSIEEQRVIGAASREADNLIATLKRLISKKQEIKRGMMQQLLTGKTRLPGFFTPWGQKNLREVGVCHRGVSYNPDQDLFKGDRTEVVRLLRSNNVRESSLELVDLHYVHERRVAEKQFLTPGDIVICMANGSRALVGKAALFMSPADAQRYTFGAFMGAFRTYMQAADSRYVAYLMQSKEFRNWIELILSGSSINNLRPSDVEGFNTQMPDLAEQTAIAQVLGDVDAEITRLQQRLTKARAIKTGMMQQLLTGRTRLPLEKTS